MSALQTLAQITPIAEDFNYGSDNTNDVPSWYDTVSTEAWAVFYNKSGDGNSPHDSETGGIGIQNGGGGTNHYLYRSIGTYDGEDALAYGLKAGKWNGASNNRSSELLVRVYRNNTLVPSNDVDLAADAGSLLVDGDTHAFTVYTNDPLVALSGTLDLSTTVLSKGDQLYFQIVDTNPNGHAYVMDDIEVVPLADQLLPIIEDFNYGTESQKSVPYWNDSLSDAGWAVYYERSGNSNSAHDQGTGCVGFQGGAWAGTNQYLYNRIPGVYAGESGLSYSLKIARWNDATIESVASDLIIRVFRNNGFSLGDDVDVASASGSLLLDSSTHPFASAQSSPVVSLSGRLDLPAALLSTGDVLYFEIVNTNPNGAYFTMDDVVLIPSAYRVGDVAASMAAGGMEVSWRGTSNTVFTLQADDDLVAPPGWSNIISGISGADGTMSVTTPTDSTQSFFRVVMEVPRNCLMEKHAGNPLVEVRNPDIPQWRWLHAANVSILDPARSMTGKWMMYLRGSGRYDDGNHGTIGLFEQDSSGFDPFGSWEEYAGNPVISYGESGAADEKAILDTSAMQAANGDTVIYFKGKNYDDEAVVMAAVSSDGYSFEKLVDPIVDDGPCEAVYHNGLYYLFTGNVTQTNENGKKRWILQIMVRTSSQYDSFTNAPAVALSPGALGSFDSKCVYGGKIFKVSGDSRWFMVYQASDTWIDYPDLFHVAWSDDLLNWTKVENDLPLLARGDLGEWDQGAMWTGSVIEHDGSIYIYYEGWGSYDLLAERDELYYSGANSRVGVASVSVSDFLEWVDGNCP